MPSLRPYLSLLTASFLLTCSTPQMPVVAPNWAKDAVWYQIFPERFRNGDPTNDPTKLDVEFDAEREWSLSPWTSDWYKLQPWEIKHDERFYENVFDRRYGGDLQGVLDKLDYLKDLGVNALYFNPVFEAYSLHKYDASTYHHIEDNFGPNPAGDRFASIAETNDPTTWTWTSADSLFLLLIREAHARNIRVVIDGVFNHSGTRFWAFRNVRDHQEASPYRDWYDIKKWDNPATPENEFDWKGWWDHKPLPEFKEDGNGFIPPVRQYFFDITKRWMDPNGDGDPTDGIDGWRLDVANDVSPVFWKEWRSLVKKLNPEAYIVGEIWEDASHWLSGDQFDAVMNYRFAKAVKKYFIESGDRAFTSSAFEDELTSIREDYQSETNYILQNLIDSHDTDRLLSMIANPGNNYDDMNGLRNNPAYNSRRPSDESRAMQRLIALFQATYLGAPMYYYGAEAGMWGADDPDDRKPMVWDDLTYEPEATSFDQKKYDTPDPVVFDREMHLWYKKIIALRNQEVALRRGTLESLSQGDPDIVAFKRVSSNDTVVVVTNRHSAEKSVTLEISGPWTDLLTGASVSSPVTVGGTSGLVLKRN